MKIAIPSETDQGLESMRFGHFGHAPYFTVVTYDEDMNITDVEVAKNVSHDECGCGGVIQHVLQQGWDGVLAAGMGGRPFMAFTQGGMAVYMETQTPKVGDVAKLFAEGKVARMSPDAACNHHHG